MELEDYRWKQDVDLGKVTPRKPKTKTRRTKPFLKGPVSWDWIERAATSKNRSTVLVGLVIWYLSGRQQTTTGVVLCAKQTEKLSLGRKGFTKGLQDLTRLGLIRTEKQPGRCVRVEILAADEVFKP
jgi:hypothetical protein